MKIETKFDVNDDVFIIYGQSIASVVVHGITLEKGIIRYAFYPGNSLLIDGSSRVFYRSESECFSSIDELCEYYKSKLAQ